MKEKINWKIVLHRVGVFALILGAIDPLEGSVVLLAGGAFLVIAGYLNQDKHRKIFLLCFSLMLIGIFFLFYFSSLGGFGGTSTLSWWWGLLILPYPIGWLTLIILLIIRTRNKKRIAAMG